MDHDSDETGDGSPASRNRQAVTLPGHRLVMVLGMTQRVGTNHLFDLLLLHPRLAAPGWMHEDYLILHSDHLVRYAGRVSSQWTPAWGVPRAAGRDLELSLGRALEEFVLAGVDLESPVPLFSGAPRRGPLGDREWFALTKTPSIRGLRNVHRLLPSARLVVIVRGGPATVESAVRSFGGTYESWMRTWAAAASEVVDFFRSAPPRSVLVRYEDLVRDRAGEMRRVLEALDLPVEEFPFDRVDHLPVRGSSQTAGVDGPDFSPREPDATFDPLARAGSWDERLLRRFRWIAGSVVEQLGYRHLSEEPDPLRERFTDLRVLIGRGAARLERGVKRRVRRLW
ncbi:MAG: hypothetical protein KatS3mg008_0471 [Acidimicrobiales bacterium]|nr:MAG: hypothetical protein KatS3mg008_0471 [Acidimicrobiales bacterium]